jgi:hypothetical protein
MAWLHAGNGRAQTQRIKGFPSALKYLVNQELGEGQSIMDRLTVQIVSVPLTGIYLSRMKHPQRGWASQASIAGNRSARILMR